MPFIFEIPRIDGSRLQVTLGEGGLLFVVGANGSGKSSLMQRMYSAYFQNARWIQAHRQSWFQSNAINLTPEQKRAYDNNVRGSDTNVQARWRDDYAVYRPGMAIYDLVDAENMRARRITAAVDANDLDLAKSLSRVNAPIKAINDLLRQSNIPIEIEIQNNEQIFARKNGGPPYSVAEMSDGERNAVLLAAYVLTVPQGSLVLIDEPERHLHRSIVSPLITLLQQKRLDCAFAVSSHDIGMPIDNPQAQTLVVRSCVARNGGAIDAWDVELLPEGAEIADDIKTDILGGRRKLLFVEGNATSLDKPLYSLLFPTVSVIAKSSCRDVEHAVFGIRDAAGLHWVSAFGIVDNDGRAAQDVVALRRRGVFALPVFSVESVYYDVGMQRRVVVRHVEAVGGDVEVRLAAARQEAIAAIRPDADRLAARIVQKSVRDAAIARLPKLADVQARRSLDIRVDVATMLDAERKRLNNELDRGDMGAVIARYPVRETPALDRIATALGLQSRLQYEDAVRKLLIDDPEARTYARSLFSELVAELEA